VFLIFELISFFQLILSRVDLQDKVGSGLVFMTVIIYLHKSTSDYWVWLRPRWLVVCKYMRRA